MILVKTDGTELDRLIGYKSPENFIPALFNIMQNRNTLDDYLNRLASHPDSFDLMIKVAEKYQYRGQADSAKGYYNYIIENDPENTKGYTDNSFFALGRMEQRGKNYDEAIEYFEKLEADYPASELYEDACIYVPYIYMKTGNDKKALKLFEEFKKKFPESNDLKWVDKQIKKIKEGKKK